MYAQTKELPVDLAKVGYWEKMWKQTHSVREVSRLSYYDFRMSKLLSSLVGPGSRVIEIGCGGSRWIGFLDRVLKCETWGIDYSAEGLAITERSNAGSPSVHLIAGDFFDESLLPRNYFDLVFSGGFIEHFTDPAVVTRRIGQILRPGGRVLTLTPNLVGIYKNIQRLVDREIFEKHVPMDRASLDAAHITANLVPVRPADFGGCFAPGVVNYGVRKRFLLPPIKLIQQLVCWSLNILHLDHESRMASPYILGVYQKPQE